MVKNIYLSKRCNILGKFWSENFQIYLCEQCARNSLAILMEKCCVARNLLTTTSRESNYNVIHNQNHTCMYSIKNKTNDSKHS